MLRASVIFFIIGLLTLFLGASDLAGLSFEAGKLLLWVFLLLSLVSLIAGISRQEGLHALPKHSDR
jgi:uncharacterized membrane protein YtjA (UPF0391 family)